MLQASMLGDKCTTLPHKLSADLVCERKRKERREPHRYVPSRGGESNCDRNLEQ